MGDEEARASALVESALGYHSEDTGALTECRRTGTGTLSVGQFDWGGRLQKSNGGAQRLPLRSWKLRKQSVKAEGSLTGRLTSRAGTKVGLSDPAV